MPTERLNGVQLHYDIVGSGDTVILTHGSWGDGDGWQLTTDVLSRTHRVVTWDRRGHSRSEDGRGPGSIAQDVDDLTALIEHVSDGPIHAVGNSYGAVITYALAASRPDHVRSAAVHEPPMLGLLESSTDPHVKEVAEPFFAEMGRVKSYLEQGNNYDAPRHFIDHIIYGEGAWDTFPQEARDGLARNAPTFLDELQGKPYGHVDLDALSASDVPLLLTVGTESPEFLRLVAQMLNERVPPIQMAWIEGADHLPHAGHPEEWSAVLRGFWQNIA